MRSHVPNGRVKSRPMDEFELIDRLIDALGDKARGPGDHSWARRRRGLLEIPPHSVVVSSIDTLVADVTFPLLRRPT